MTDRNDAIQAVGLVKRYRGTAALGGVDLRVPAGTVLGLLGPNGAGKTTAVRILATLLPMDAGHAKVAGYDVAREPDRVRARIGLAGQYAAVDERLTGRENLVLVGTLYHLGRKAAARRADELLLRFGLAGAGDRQARTYSGGMRRRLDLAAAILAGPPVLFLDEPTTGLDPAARAELWQAVRGLAAGGTSVLLTTQYLEEADQLAGKIAVLAAGRVIAEGTSEELKQRFGGEHLEITVGRSGQLAAAAAILARAAGTKPTVETASRRASVPMGGTARRIAAVAAELAAAGIDLSGFAVRQPTLDEVFFNLTGRRASGTPAPEGQAA
ncbi:MAG TPA: ATP-binding cassette domain-containing protein [Streptosporangiaceae bacterium]|nr:ATP-binding cassette domain-containing protein [Streptosporangiaceae bacterium]